eukprot:UN03048
MLCEDHFVYFAGHSLGGALSEICGARFYDEIHHNVKSFSSANPGTLYAAKKFGYKTGYEIAFHFQT